MSRTQDSEHPSNQVTQNHSNDVKKESSPHKRHPSTTLTEIFPDDSV
jgi:hypothetical protein